MTDETVALLVSNLVVLGNQFFQAWKGQQKIHEVKISLQKDVEMAKLEVERAKWAVEELRVGSDRHALDIKKAISTNTEISTEAKDNATSAMEISSNTGDRVTGSQQAIEKLQKIVANVNLLGRKNHKS